MASMWAPGIGGNPAKRNVPKKKSTVGTRTGSGGNFSGFLGATSPSNADPDGDDGTFDENIDDNTDDVNADNADASSLQHMLAAIQAQEQKHKQQTKALQARIAQMTQQLSDRDERIGQLEHELSEARTNSTKSPTDTPSEQPAPTMVAASNSAANEERILELEQELETMRSQKRELMQLQQQDKTTSVLLAQELQVQSHLVQEKSVEMAALRTQLQELQIKFDMETDAFAAERKQFQAKITHLQRTLQHEETAVLNANNESQSLSANVLQLTQENVALGEQLRVQEAKIREVLDAFQQRERELAHLREQHALLVNQLGESAQIQQENSAEMKKSSEQLRQMAEKVFALLAQIQKQEAWRTKAIEEQRASTSKIAELQNQIEEKQDVLNHEIKTRAKLEKDLGFVQKSLEDQRLLVIDLRRKLAAEENKTRALQVQLKNKVEECDELHTKHSQLSLQARQVQAVADKQRVATSAMEERLRHSAHTIITLQGRTEALQQALAKATIAAQGPTHEDEFQQTRNNLPTRRATTGGALGKSSSGARASSSGGDRPPSSLTRYSGASPQEQARVAELLRAFRIDESTAMAMAKQPMTLLTKMADMYDHMQSKLRQASGNLPVEDNASLSSKYNELTLKLQQNDQARAKMLQSLTSMLTKVQNVLVISAEPPVKSSFFLTNNGQSGGDDGSAASSDGAGPNSLTSTSLNIDEELSTFFRTVNLSDHNLGDDGAKVVADSIRVSHNIHHLDVSRNHIKSEGLAQLIQALVLDSCSVHNIDMSMNDINAEGLLTLATILQRMHHVVRTATFLSSLPSSSPSGAAAADLANFGSSEADSNSSFASSSQAKIRPIVEIGTNTKTIYLDLSHNLFDERVMSRLVNLCQADLNDPIVRQIIIQSRKSIANASQQQQQQQQSKPTPMSPTGGDEKRSNRLGSSSSTSNLNSSSSFNRSASRTKGRPGSSDWDGDATGGHSSSLHRSSSAARLSSSSSASAAHAASSPLARSSSSQRGFGASSPASPDHGRSMSNSGSMRRSASSKTLQSAPPPPASGMKRVTEAYVKSSSSKGKSSSSSGSGGSRPASGMDNMSGFRSSKTMSTDDLVRAAMSGADAMFSNLSFNSSGGDV